jgi:hypothetical protein
VTALDVPPLAGPTKVPEPVSLIDRVLGFLAEANATPPALSVGGVVAAFMWMISQRTWSAAPCTTGSPKVIDNNTVKDTTALTRIHFDTILMFVLLEKEGPGSRKYWFRTMRKKLGKEDENNRGYSAPLPPGVSSRKSVNATYKLGFIKAAGRDRGYGLPLHGCTSRSS